MSNRTAKFVSAIFASLLAGAPFTTISHSAAAECLSGPKDQTPEGGHWYYRIEHPSQRQCWYLRMEDGKPLQLASPSLGPAAKPVPAQTQPAMQRSIADARAELPRDTTAAMDQRTPVPATDSTGAGTDTVRANAGLAAPQASPQASVVTSRWPTLTDMNSPVAPQPAAAVAAAPAPVAPPTAVAAAPAPSKVMASPAVTAIPLATADTTSKSQFGSIQMLLTIVMGALSLAAVMGGAIFRFGSTRSIKPEVRVARRVNWGAGGSGSLARSAYTPRMPEGDMARDPRAADDPDRRIAEMLARLSRSAAA